MAERKIESGLVCVIGSLEPSPTFEHRRTHIIRRTRPCHVLYQYQIDPEVGWMHARIQTWFPFNIQVALNGREWLSRQMDQEKLRYRQQGNCFVWIEDYEQVQKLLNRQLETNWAELLNGFAAMLNPDHEQLFMASFRKCLALIVIRHQSRTCHPPCRPNQCSSTQPVSHGSRKIAAAPQETKIQ